MLPFQPFAFERPGRKLALASPFEPRRFGLVRCDQHDLVVTRASRPARACCCRGRRSGWRRASDHALCVTDQSSGELQVPAWPRHGAAALSFFDPADLERCFAGTFSSRGASATSGATITAMPTPQLNVRAISSAAIRPPACRSEKMEGHCQRSASMIAWQVSGRTRGIFSRRPPPVMCARPLILPFCTNGSSART